MEQVAELVDRFCKTEYSFQEHDDALEKIVTGIVGRLFTIADVVAALGQFLTATNELLRARGTLLLSSLLEKLSPSAGYVDGQQQKFLLAFLLDRARDSPCVGEVARGMLAMLEHWPLIEKEVEGILTCIFTQVFAQSHDQPTRNTLLRIMDNVMTNHLPTARALDHDFVFGYLQMIDGERDPRNLLLIFQRLTPAVVANIPGHARFVEDLFDVTSCYYPINFTPRAGDSLTSEMLVNALDAAMRCLPEFASLCVPFLLEKMGEKASAQLWESFLGAVRTFGPTCLTRDLMQPVWEIFSREIFSSDASQVAAAVYALGALIGILSVDFVSSSDCVAPLDVLIARCVVECGSHLAGSLPDTANFAISIRALSSAAAASAHASQAIASATIPVLLEAGGRDGRVAVQAASLVSSLHPARVLAPYTAPLLALGLSNGSAALLVALLGTQCMSHDQDVQALEAIVRAKDASAISAVARSREALVCEKAFFLLQKETTHDASWYAMIRGAGEASGRVLLVAWSTILRDEIGQGHLVALETLAQCTAPLDSKRDGDANAAAELFPGLLSATGVSPNSFRATMRVLSAEQQTQHVAALLERASRGESGAWAALSALHASVPIPRALDIARVALRASEWSDCCLANWANKGQLSTADVESLLATATLAPATLGWIARGLVLGAAPASLIERVLRELVDLLAVPSSKNEAATALAVALSSADARVSSQSTNARERPFGRQRSFAFLLPLLVPHMHALARVLCQMPAAVLLGELNVLLPMLVHGVSNSDSAVSASSMEALCSLLPDASASISMHADSLLPRVAGLCSPPAPIRVRMAALALIEAAVSTLPWARIFPVREPLVRGVCVALDDRKRDVRKVAVRVSNRLHMMTGN